jgi:hypothetical protein
MPANAVDMWHLVGALGGIDKILARLIPTHTFFSL